MRPPDVAGPWDSDTSGVLHTDSLRLRLISPTAGVSSRLLELPALGSYHVRAYSRVLGIIDRSQPPGFPHGMERWLIRVWPV
ncbi:hypothetical protein [Streptomyces sp. NPDC054863]